MVNIAINGFGRIGRMVFRAGIDNPKVNFVAINDLTSTKNLAYLLKYDSVHGPFPGKVDFTEDSLIIDDKHIPIISERDPADLPWKKYEVDVAIESTGLFTHKKDAMKHLDAGAKKVLVSAPCKCGPDEEPVKTIVMGVNEHEMTADDVIVSNASCTTNCLAPMAKVLDDNFKIESGLMTTIHSFTSSQNVVDGPHKKDPRRGRSAAASLIPTSTGAAKAIGDVIPSLNGKLDGMAVRVPLPDGSLTDLTVHVKEEATVEKVNELFKNVADHHMKGILKYTEDPIVSADILTDPHSCIFDSKLTKVIDKHLIKVLGWYDNEFGYSNRMIDLVLLMAGLE